MLTHIPDNVCSGRTRLRTDLPLNASALQIQKDLERVLKQHAYNMDQIRRLQEYHRGWHPAIQKRKKTTRTDVDNKITVNKAKAMTRDIVGYFLNKPIQYVNRSGTYRKQMEKFVQVLEAENKSMVDFQIAEDCSICGVGYRGVFSEKTALNGTHLKMLRLDPMTTFVVHSSNPVGPPVYAVSFYDTTADTLEGKTRTRHYTVYTATQMYRFEDKVVNGNDPSGAITALTLSAAENVNFGGGLPIIEYQNNMWRMGDWETEIALMDAIDFVTSDGVNDIQQAVNSVLVAMGMELTLGDFEALSVNGMLNVANIPPGVNPVVEFISQAMNADVGTAMREYLESTLREVVGVPDRKTRGGGGGDTGDAVFLRDGWQDIDLVATAKEPYFIEAERTALHVILYILETHKEIANLKAENMEIHFNRNKTANVQSKAQVYQILTSGEHPLAPEDALDIASLTNQVNDVIMRSESYVAEMQEKRMKAAETSNLAPNSDEGGSRAEGDEDGNS